MLSALCVARDFVKNSSRDPQPSFLPVPDNEIERSVHNRAHRWCSDGNQFGCLGTYLPTACSYIAGKDARTRSCTRARARRRRKMSGALAARDVIRVTWATCIRGNNLICRIACTQWPRVCTRNGISGINGGGGGGSGGGASLVCTGEEMR